MGDYRSAQKGLLRVGALFSRSVYVRTMGVTPRRQEARNELRWMWGIRGELTPQPRRHQMTPVRAAGFDGFQLQRR